MKLRKTDLFPGILAALLLCTWLSCQKSNDSTPSDMLQVVYEVESQTSVPFGPIKFTASEKDSGVVRSVTHSWTVSGVGLFQKTVLIKKEQVALLDVQHPSSNQWKIRIRSTDGSLLVEGPVKFAAGSPGYYYSHLELTIN